jgi:geranylgeranyl diphosphate synthase type II
MMPDPRWTPRAPSFRIRRMASIQTTAFLQFAKDIRQQVDKALELTLQLDTGCPDELRAAMRHSLMAPCKRLRPLLVLMAAEACGSSRERAMPAACAVEMIHTYSLIHDDLPAMDDDDLRRGLPSCHAAFGEATAILAGDGLLTLAFGTLAAGIEPGNVAAHCCRELASAAGPCGMVGGQADDLHAETGGGGLDELESIHRRKTGAMFNVSLKLGAIVAGADDQQMSGLQQYGQAIGLAFQIVDDLLDLSGDAQLLGKNTQKDAERGKLTFPGLLGEVESRRRAEALIEEACQAVAQFGSGASELDSLARYVLERNH